MKKHLQRILSLLCVLALVLGTVSALAEDPTVQYDARIITVQWDDGDNYDGLRPAQVKATLAGQEVELKEENGWAAEASVPRGSTEAWSFETPEGYVASQDNGTEILKVTFRHAVAPTVEKSATVTWNDGNNAGKIRPASVQLMLLADGEPYGEPRRIPAGRSPGRICPPGSLLPRRTLTIPCSSSRRRKATPLPLPDWK